MTDNNRRPHWLVVILLVLIAVLLVANLVVMGFLLKQGKAVSTGTRRSLPCESVPVRFVLDEPECADKLIAFADQYPGSDKVAGFREAATKSAGWAAVQEWIRLVQVWKGEFFPKTESEIAERVQAIQDYASQYPATPISEKALEAYVAYLGRAQLDVSDAGPWKGDLADIMKSPIMFDLYYVKDRDGKKYYTPKGSKAHSTSAGLFVKVISSIEDLTETKSTLIKNTTFTQPMPSPQLAFAKDVLRRLGTLDVSNCDTFGLEMAQFVQDQTEIDPVLRATLLNAVLSHIENVGPEEAKRIKQAQSALSLWSLDNVTWLDPEDPEASVLRSEIEDALKQIGRFSDVKAKMAKQRQAMIDPLQIQCAGCGLVLRRGAEWTVKARPGLIKEGRRIVVVAEAPGGTRTELREIGVVKDGKCAISGAQMTGVPEGSMAFVLERAKPK